MLLSKANKQHSAKHSDGGKERDKGKLMSKTQITNLLISNYGISWEAAYHYASTAEWDWVLAGIYIREDVKNGNLYR